MKNKLNQPIEETTKWSPHQGICSVKECLWNGRRHPEESNQPIEEKWKETLRKSWGTNALGEDDYGCDGADDNCCGNCGGWIADIDKFEYFIENLLEQERRRMGDEIQRIEERLSDSERWPIGERKRMQNTIKKVLSIINK